jgi:hypothetical protein
LIYGSALRAQLYMMTTQNNKSGGIKDQHHCLFTILAIALSLFISVASHAQLKTAPLERPGINTSKIKSASTGRTKSEILTLPFWEDFSTTPVYDSAIDGSGYPDQKLWFESYEVWIGDGLGINSPSINIATFDGLDSAGKPYSNQILTAGFRDRLTSRSIDLSTNTVSSSERLGVFLSFYYQWQGNGEAPDNNDFLRLEFLTADSTWVAVATKYGSDEIAKDAFTRVIVQVSGDQYFHDEFRFRFRNYGNQSGPYDSWNLDYIYLDKGRTADDAGSPDRALASGLSQIFGRYRSVPLNHYRAAPVYTASTIDIQNLRAGLEGSPTDIYLQQTFFNYIDGAVVKVEKPFGPIGAKYPNNFLLPGERVTSLLKTDVDPIDLDDPVFDFNAYFLPDADSIDLKVRINLFEPDAGIFLANDTLSTTFHLNDYYAYDDGTAEYSVLLNQSDDQVALGFDLLSDEPRELVGFDIYIPQFSINGFTSVDFFIMDSENGEPGQRLTSITHIAQTNNRDEFQSIRFDPILVTGRFFIGWKGSAGNQIKVGLDYSNNTSDLIYEDLNGVMENGQIKWFPTQSLTEGTIMIRPNFGTASTNTGVITEKNRINFYPNPSEGSFYIEGEIDNLEIFSPSGQRIPTQQTNQGEKTLITLPEVSPGLYILKMKKGKQFLTEKLVVQK